MILKSDPMRSASDEVNLITLIAVSYSLVFLWQMLQTDERNISYEPLMGKVIWVISTVVTVNVLHFYHSVGISRTELSMNNLSNIICFRSMEKKIFT